MKKLISLIVAALLFSINISAQNAQTELNNFIKSVINRLHYENLVPKSVQTKNDSLLISFKTYDYNAADLLVKFYNYEYEMVNLTMALSSANYMVYDDQGKIVETGEILKNGDTSTKTLITLTNENNYPIQEFKIYNYEGADPVLISTMTFYGAVEDTNMNFDFLSTFLGVTNINICDSFLIETEVQGESLQLHGYCYYNKTTKKVSKISIDFNMETMPVEVVVKPTYTGNNITKIDISLQAMGGIVTANLVTIYMTYDEQNNLLTSEIIPQANELIDLTEMIGKIKTVNVYKDGKIIVTTHLIDSLGAYMLGTRDFYVYNSKGLLDTLYTYSYFESSESVVNNTELEVGISPNPVKDILTISGLTEMTDIYVYDANGRIVMRERFSDENNSLSMQNLANGIYIVKISNSLGTSVKKITKH